MIKKLFQNYILAKAYVIVITQDEYDIFVITRIQGKAKDEY